jgi:hypothetical protein
MRSQRCCFARLVDFLDAGALLCASTGETAGCSTAREATSTTWEATGSASSTGVELLHDRVGNTLELLLLLLVLLFRCLLRAVKPRDGLVDSSLQLGLVSGVKLASELLVVEGVAEIVRVRLKAILGRDASGSSLILS